MTHACTNMLRLCSVCIFGGWQDEHFSHPTDSSLSWFIRLFLHFLSLSLGVVYSRALKAILQWTIYHIEVFPPSFCTIMTKKYFLWAFIHSAAAAAAGCWMRRRMKKLSNKRALPSAKLLQSLLQCEHFSVKGKRKSKEAWKCWQ